MPRYYFNILKPGHDPLLDDGGLDFQDDAVARVEAFASLRDVIADSLTGTIEPIHVSIEILKEGTGVIDRFTARIDVDPVHPQPTPN